MGTAVGAGGTEPSGKVDPAGDVDLSGAVDRSREVGPLGTAELSGEVGPSGKVNSSGMVSLSGEVSPSAKADLLAKLDLSGKTAVVTGSGRGLGLGYARALSAAGAAVVVNDVDAEAAASAAKSIVEAGGRAVAVTAAVGSTETADALVAAAVEHFGRLDVMVTNAGVLRDKVLWKMTDDDFDTVINVHLRGTFTCVRAAAVQMRGQGTGGRIIVAGSPTGQRGTFGQANYAAAKAGIVGMMRTWAMELARDAITVNALIPVAATAMTRTIPFFAPHVEALENDGIPLPAALRKGEGFGTVDDVAGLVVFLASDAAGQINGQAIGIGGDRLALWSHPQEKLVSFADGDEGWSAEAIAAAWPSTFGRSPETVGIPAPQL